MKDTQNEKTPNIVVLAARTPAGKMHLLLATLAMIIIIVMVILMDDYPDSIVGAFLNRHVFVLMLPGFLSMASIEQFSLVANAIRMDMEAEEQGK